MTQKAPTRDLNLVLYVLYAVLRTQTSLSSYCSYQSYPFHASWPCHPLGSIPVSCGTTSMCRILTDTSTGEPFLRGWSFRTTFPFSPPCSCDEDAMSVVALLQSTWSFPKGPPRQPMVPCRVIHLICRWADLMREQIKVDHTVAVAGPEAGRAGHSASAFGNACAAPKMSRGQRGNLVAQRKASQRPNVQRSSVL